jgi:hypothetical protein
MGYVSSSTELLEGLEERVQRVYHFSKDRLLENLQPMVKEDDFVLLESLLDKYRDLVRYYFNSFFNKSYSTLVLPGQTASIYDYKLLKYVYKIVNVHDIPNHAFMRIPNIDGDLGLAEGQVDIWDILLERDSESITHCNDQFSTAHTRSFNRNPFLMGLSYNNIEYLVYPTDVDTSMRIANRSGRFKCISSKAIYDSLNRDEVHYGNYDDTYIDNLTNCTRFGHVSSDEYYIFSKDFYKLGNNLTLLEQLVLDYLNKRAINLKKLHDLLNNYRNLTRLDQFYYGPILLTLIKEARKDIYT